MKSFLFLFLIAGFISFPIAAQQIIFLYNSDYYPFEFNDERGNPDGFVIDLLYALARESTFDVTFVSGNWEKGDQKLINDEIDLMAGYENKKANSSIVDSKPLFSVPFTLLYRSTIKPPGEEGLHTSIPVLSSGDSAEPLLEKRISSSKIIRTANWSDAVEALKRGYGDYTIISLEHWNLLQDKYAETLSSMENFNLSIPYVFKTTQWDKNLLEQLDNSISIIRASGEYDRIVGNWFGKDNSAIITYKPKPNRTGIIFISAAAVSIIIITIIRKRKVKT